MSTALDPSRDTDPRNAIDLSVNALLDLPVDVEDDVDLFTGDTSLLDAATWTPATRTGERWRRPATFGKARLQSVALPEPAFAAVRLEHPASWRWRSPRSSAARFQSSTCEGFVFGAFFNSQFKNVRNVRIGRWRAARRRRLRRRIHAVAHHDELRLALFLPGRRHDADGAAGVALGHVGGDVEGVAQLVRHEDRAHVLEVAELMISSSTVVAVIGSRPVVASS